MGRAALVLTFVCSLPLAAQERSVASGDGLRLGWSPEGRLVSLSLDDTPLPLVRPGGFGVIDYQDQPLGDNLIPNAGFETDDGWTLSATQRHDDLAHDGNRSVRLAIPGPEPGSSNLEVRVPVSPNTKYQLGLFARRENCRVCAAFVSEYGADGKLSTPVTQIGLPIPMEDGVWHKLERELVTGPTTTELLLRATIYRSTGTLWVDDFFIRPDLPPAVLPVTGAAAEGEALRIDGTAADCRVEARVTGDETGIRLTGSVTDRAGRDRAIGLVFELPFDATGWTWWDDTEDRRPIDGPRPYRNTYGCVSGEGDCSIYPWSALSGAGGGLSLGLPLDQGPRSYVLEYDPASRSFRVVIYFGLSAAYTPQPGGADFDLVLYRHDPADGMRGAVATYQARYPEMFAKRPTYEGYLNYVGLEDLDPKTHQIFSRGGGRFDDYSDFGEGYVYLQHVHGCYWFKMMPTDQRERPDDETVFAYLESLAAKEEAGESTGYLYVPTREAMKKIVYDRDGKISYIGDTRYWDPHEGYNHSDQPGWGLNFRVNEDPDLSDYLAERDRRAAAEYRAAHPEGAWEACFTADAIEGYHANSRCLDHRREHWATSSFPLTFDAKTLQPGLPNTIWDYLHDVWEPLTDETRIVTYGNANAYEQAFTMPLVDIPMVETDWDREHPERVERYLRTMGGQRIWRWWRTLGEGENDPASVVRHFHRGLAYAIYPAVYPLLSTDPSLDHYRHYYRRFVPAIEQLSRAGWEPLPRATVTPAEVIAERYGTAADGDLQFTLRNYGTVAVEARLEPDLAALGLGEAKLLTYDLLEGPHSARPWTGQPIPMGPDTAAAVWLGSAADLERRVMDQTRYDLGRLQRLFAADATPATDALLAKAIASTDQPADSVAAAAAIRAALERWADALATAAEVDRDKVLLRLEADLGGLAPALLGVRAEAPRVVEAPRGQRAEVRLRLINSGGEAVELTSTALLSPWPLDPQAMEFGPAKGTIPAGGHLDLSARLAVPVEVPRSLLPYVLTANLRQGDRELPLAVPVDVVVTPTLVPEVGNARIYRGRDTELTLTVTNRGAAEASGTLQLGPVAGLTFEPPAVPFTAPAGATVPVRVTITAIEATHLGPLKVPYRIESEDPALRSTGQLVLPVSVPVPQVEVPRAASPVTVDGKLDEAAWAGPPTIPALGLMRTGDPPREATEVRVVRDEAPLYVSFRCAESNLGALKAEKTARGDALYLDDDVEVFLLAPSLRRPRQFAVNPLGTRNDNFGNDQDWTAAAARGDGGWTVELRIPFESLEMSPPIAAGTAIRAQFGRQQKPRGEVSSWTVAGAFSDANRFGDLLLR